MLESEYSPLTAAQLAAVRDYARDHGRYWKAALGAAWERASEPGILQHLRNTHGPRWLANFRLPVARPGVRGPVDWAD